MKSGLTPKAGAMTLTEIGRASWADSPESMAAKSSDSMRNVFFIIGLQDYSP
jgi:hypothetical protein